MPAPTFHHCGALVAVCLLAGCGKLPVDQTPDAPPSGALMSYGNWSLEVFKDPTTGCEYLQNQSHGGVTPRMERDPIAGYRQRGCK